MDSFLPPELMKGATLRGKECAWELNAFPNALETAPHLGYACLGGQFWFLLPDDSVYEPFWLEADSSDRMEDEAWPQYAQRSCAEVRSRFDSLMTNTNFLEEAKKFSSLDPANSRLLFNAYFITEHEELHSR